MKAKPKSQGTMPPEEQLLDYAKRLRRHRSDRRAVYIMLSNLTKMFRQTHHVRAATECFKALLKSYEGQIFQMGNSDLLVALKGASIAEIDKAVLKVRYMFRDDENVRQAEDKGDDILTRWFDIAHNYDEFLDFAQHCFDNPPKQNSLSAPAPPKISLPTGDGPAGSSSTASPQLIRPDEQVGGVIQTKANRSVKYVKIEKEPVQTDIRPMDAEAMAQLEKSMLSMDVMNLIKKERISIITGDAPPQPIIYHRHVPVSSLQKLAMPGRDLHSDPWFLGRIRDLLSKRLLASGPEMTNADSLASSISMTVDSVFSDAFETFERKLGSLPRSRVILCFPLMEMLSNASRYWEGLDIVKGLGFRTALSDIDLFSFTMLDRSVAIADFDRITWRQDQVHLITGAYRERFAHAVKNAGAARIILTGCDTDTALEFGQAVGIRLFEGDVTAC